MRKGLGRVKWLTTAHLVGSPAQMYGLTLYAVEPHAIVTKVGDADRTPDRQIHINSRFSSSFEPCHQQRMRRPGLENVGLGDREHN